jgi:ADP-ribose pyrophosphatase
MKKKSDCLKSRKLVGDNRYFLVFYDCLQENDEPPVEDYVVVQPKIRTPENVYAVGILPIRDGKVGLLDIYRHPLEENKWEIPGGFIELGEADETSALRELHEECGLICEPKNLKDLGIISTSPSTIAAKAHLFVAVDCKLSTEDRIPELGHGNFEWFSKSEIEALIMSSKVQEVSTLITLYRAQELY